MDKSNTYEEQRNMLLISLPMFYADIEDVCKRYKQVFNLIRLNSFKYEESVIREILTAATNFEDFLEGIKIKEPFSLNESDVVIMHKLFFIEDIAEDLKLDLTEHVSDCKALLVLRNFTNLYLEKAGILTPEPFSFKKHYSASYQKGLLMRIVDNEKSFINTIYSLQSKIQSSRNVLLKLLSFFEEESSQPVTEEELKSLKSSLAYLTLSGSFEENELEHFKEIILFANNI